MSLYTPQHEQLYSIQRKMSSAQIFYDGHIFIENEQPLPESDVDDNSIDMSFDGSESDDNDDLFENDTVENLSKIVARQGYNFDSLITSYGYVGGMVHPTLFVKYPKFPETYMLLDENGCFPMYGVHMLKEMMLTTGHEYVYDYYNERGIVKVGGLVTAYLDNQQIIQGIYDDDDHSKVFVLDDNFKIVKSISYEQMIKASNTIKKTLKEYILESRADKFRKTKLQRKIMDALVQYSFRPEGKTAQRLGKRFREICNELVQ